MVGRDPALTRFEPYLKAIVAAAIAGLTSVTTALADDSVSSLEGVTAALAVLVAFSAVWAVPNRTG